MTYPRIAIVLSAGGTLLLSAGCNLAPRYDPPTIESPSAFKEAAGGDAAGQGWKIAVPQDAAIRGHWWEAYQDTDLNQLESRVAVSNQTILAAEANYRAARALVLEAQAQLYPTLSLDPAVTRSRSSAAVSSLGGSVSTGTAAGTTTGTSTRRLIRSTYGAASAIPWR